MAIQFLKLLDGDDIVSETEKTADGYILTSPAKLIIAQEGLGMMPMNPFITDKKITLPSNFVVYVGTPETEIKNAYNSKFGSGIVLATGGSGLLKHPG